MLKDIFNKSINIHIPQKNLKSFTSLAEAIETLHNNQKDIFVENMYFEEGVEVAPTLSDQEDFIPKQSFFYGLFCANNNPWRSTKQLPPIANSNTQQKSIGSCMLPLMSRIGFNVPPENNIQCTDYYSVTTNSIIEIDTTTSKIKLTKEADEALKDTYGAHAYALLTTPVFETESQKIVQSKVDEELFTKLKRKQYNFCDKSSSADNVKALAILQNINSAKFKDFCQVFQDSFSDKQQQNGMMSDYLNNLMDFTYSTESMLELKKAITQKNAAQIQNAIIQFYVSQYLRELQQSKENELVSLKNKKIVSSLTQDVMVKLSVTDTTYQEYIKLKNNGVGEQKNSTLLLELDKILKLLLVEKPENSNGFHPETLEVEVIPNLTAAQIEINEAIDYLENLTFEGADVTQAVKAVFASTPVQYAFDISDNFRIYAGGKAGFGYLSIVQKSKTKIDLDQRQAELICRQEGQTFNVGLEFGAIYFISDSMQAKAGLSCSAYGACESKNELNITKDTTKDNVSHDLLPHLVEQKAASLGGLSFDGLFGMQDLNFHVGLTLNI